MTFWGQFISAREKSVCLIHRCTQVRGEGGGLLVQVGYNTFNLIFGDCLTCTSSETSNFKLNFELFVGKRDDSEEVDAYMTWPDWRMLVV